ncbi:hypothetical protein QCA50_001805 [Cerrena zonata]|uniref:Polysaccharide lyase family 8 protein n=1 Tax=Cerrena zonata TaxID=2478898 RepID=A0AAW0GM09_9APHY
MSRPSLRALKPRHYLIFLAALTGLLLVIILPTVLTRHKNSASQENSPTATSSSSPQLNLTQGRISPGSVVNCTDIQCDLRVMTERRLSTIIGSTKNASFISTWLSTLGSDGRWAPSDIDYTSGCNAKVANWPALVHWQRIETLAAGWRGGLAGAENFAGNPNLRKAISSAINAWFSNDFHDLACLDFGGGPGCSCGTPGFWNKNWFSNVIALPKLVGQVCLLLNDTLLPSELDNCARTTGRAYSTFNTGIPVLGPITGANALDIASVGIDKGLLTKNTSLLFDAYKRVHAEIVIQNQVRADGIRPDGAFGQHAGILYNGNYGKDYTNDVLSLEVSAGGLQFQANGMSKDAFETLMEGSQWMIFRNTITNILHWDFSALGRFITFPVADDQATANIQFNVTELGVLAAEWSSNELMGVYDALSQNSTDANVGALAGNRMFYTNDYMVQRGPGYVTSVKMFSSRTQNTECLNGQNLAGFHISDGTVYTHVVGDEYEDIAAAWDWNLIPGITVDYGATPLQCGNNGKLGKSAFVGGASDDRTGVAVMQYQNPATGSLSWKKAWFFFENDLQHVTVSDISSKSPSPVFSVLDQKKLNGDVLVNGQAQGSGNYTAVSSLWHAGVGYTFDATNPVSLSLALGPRTGAWSAIGTSTQPPVTANIFAAWLHHEDLSKSISYSVYPATSSQSFQSKTASTNVQTLQNDKSITAARSGNVVMVVLWNSIGGQIDLPTLEGGVITLSSSTGIVVIVRLDVWDITVADPTQTASSLTLNFTVKSGNPPSQWGASNRKSLTIKLPSGGIAGSSMTRNLSQE